MSRYKSKYKECLTLSVVSFVLSSTGFALEVELFVILAYSPKPCCLGLYLRGHCQKNRKGACNCATDGSLNIYVACVVIDSFRFCCCDLFQGPYSLNPLNLEKVVDNLSCNWFGIRNDMFLLIFKSRETWI